MVEETDWDGLINGVRTDEFDVEIDTVLVDQARQGGSRPFQARSTDGEVFWVKPPDNPQGQRVPVNEQIVGRCGALIGAPVCQVVRVQIPNDLDGHELSTGRTLQTGIAHGSADVAKATFAKGSGPIHRDKDDNSRRHVGLFALHDWCWGSDGQWLYDAGDDMMTFSHDHGHYFPSGPNWTVDSLRNAVDTDHRLAVPSNGLDADSLRTTADRLDAITRDDLVVVIGSIPARWSITNGELETLGYFLDRRRETVAARLREIAAHL